MPDEPQQSTEGTPVTAVLQPADELQSWKEIAGFIGRDERTAMRWAKEQGMPIHRVPGGKRGRVFASKAEILAWLGREAKQEIAVPETAAVSAAVKPSLTRFWMVALFAVGAAAVLLTLAIRTRSNRPGLPSSVRFSENSLRVEDVSGNALWVYGFKQNLYPPALGARKLNHFVRVADFLGDGDREVMVVAPFRLGNNPDDPVRCEVEFFSSSGKRLWSYAPQETILFGEKVLTGPWIPMDLTVSNSTKPQIWMAFADREWGNSYVVKIDPKSGKGVVTYVNSGTIHAVNEIHTPQATYLVTGGFDNEHDGPNAAFMDESRSFAASPQTDGTDFKCTSCAAGSPDYYFVFPRSEINRFRKTYEDAVWTIAIQEGGLSVSESPSIGTDPDLQKFFFFDVKPSIHPSSIRYSSDYDVLHRELERSNQIHHSLETCPERLQPAPIKAWTPSTGWSEIDSKHRPIKQ